MSSHEYDKQCPNCFKDMCYYADTKPFETIYGECLNCGFTLWTETAFKELTELNEIRTWQDLKPISKKVFIKIKREDSLAKAKSPNYEEAYNILMDYFDYLPDEDKKELDKELKRCGP